MKQVERRIPKAFYGRVQAILESAVTAVARTVNTTQVMANWLIGMEIVNEEQMGRERATYGEHLLRSLAEKLQADFGRGYSYANLKLMRQFYLAFPALLNESEIGYAVRSQSGRTRKGYAVRSLSAPTPSARTSNTAWSPGRLHPNLSWTHYRTLIRVSKVKTRAFYEIEAINNSWSARELERQIASLLFERLAKSRDKRGLHRMATRGQEIQKPADVFKDPFVMEFLSLEESEHLLESDLETALINKLQGFLLEMGKGFALVARQDRLTLEGDLFYIDLVFYHTVLKCYILIDLKVGKINHADLGQMLLYVNYYDRVKRAPDDNPTLGLILGSDKNDAVVKYTLGPDQQKKIFASRYKLHLPTVEELQEEIRRNRRRLTSERPTRTPRKKKP